MLNGAFDPAGPVWRQGQAVVKPAMVGKIVLTEGQVQGQVQQWPSNVVDPAAGVHR